MKDKVLLTLIIICVFVLTLGAVSASAETYSGMCGVNVRWSLNTNTGVLNITGAGEMSFLKVSSYTSAPWYGYQPYIKIINISNGVTNIDNRAFEDCSALTNITIPSSVTSIGDDAFNNCSELTSIAIPSGVKTLGSWAFYNCSKLTNIMIPSKVTSIDDYAFRACSGITNIIIPSSVTNIGNCVFDDCVGLKKISVEDGNTVYKSDENCLIRIIDNCLIAGCKNSVLPNYIQSIGNCAFNGCTGLKSITIPSGVTSIGNSAFYGCDGLTSLLFEENSKLTSIGNSAFMGCIGITGITIPSSVTSIGNHSFSNCSELASITIPSGVTSIGDNAFNSCLKLRSITFDKNSGLNSIGEYAFNRCSKLTSIIIPSGVISIGNYTFLNCAGLTNIKIPNSVTNIGNYAFEYCYKLNKIYFIGTQTQWNSVIKGSDAIPYGVNIVFMGDCEHDYTLQAVSPTCVSKGYTRHTCSKYTYFYDDTFIDASHAWNDGEITTPPTHLSKGVKTFTCTLCSATRTEEVDKLSEHTYGEWIKHNATQHKKSCACGNIVYADHTWNGGEITTQPTHLVKGVKTFTCTLCSETRTEEVDKLSEHTYGEWTKYDATQHKKSCACGDIVYADHAWSDGEITTPPTHLSKGVKTFTCTLCSATRTEEVDKLSEHTYGEWTNHDATQHKKSCACGDIVYADHTWDNGTVTVKPTATTTGTMKYVCTVCSTEKTEEIPVLKTVAALQKEDSVIDTDDETGYARGIKDKANTVTEVLEQFSDTSNIKIVDKDGNELTGSQKLGTGSKIQITDGDGNVVDEITVIINGDVDGDGKVTLVDCMKLRAYQLGKTNEL